MHFLIVKKGALGDVVRTSYFAKALKTRFGPLLRLSWITAPASADLLRLNPNIDDLWFEFEQAKPFHFDRIFSLDDELETVIGVAALAADSVTGAILQDNRPAYTRDAAEWFDMGLHSRFGKRRADELKKLNQRSHAQIFSAIFGVEQVRPEFYLDESCRRWAQANLPKATRRVGINPYSGGRWPSKELLPLELEQLIARLLDGSSPFGAGTAVVLLGAGQDFMKNAALVARQGVDNLVTICTDESVQHLAAAVAGLDYLISSDSLALHLTIAQDVAFTAFFSPTSAVEIDDWGIGTKVVSTAPDYCSYRKDADNSTITADRIIAAIRRNPRISGDRSGAAPRG
ncbi:MAG: glycosyltransferase family 9 protein [Steroidobacterales bacterium]